MQKNTITGNIVRITKVEGSGKILMTVADHYFKKGPDGKTVQETNFVPLEGFLPKGLTLRPGQLVAVSFIVRSFKSKAGDWRTANDIVSVDATLRSKAKMSGAA